MLQPFEIKSQNSIDAANELLQKAFSNSSIHCSYYSVFQFMLHCLYEKLGGDKEADDLKSKENGRNSHDFTLNLIKKAIERRLPAKSLRDFSKRTVALKQLRVKADYQTEIINPDEGQEAYEEAQFLIKLLQDNL